MDSVLEPSQVVVPIAHETGRHDFTQGTSLRLEACSCIAVQQQHVNAGLVAVAGRLGVTYVHVGFIRGDQLSSPSLFDFF
jgi:hypothetical protein